MPSTRGIRPSRKKKTPLKRKMAPNQPQRGLARGDQSVGRPKSKKRYAGSYTIGRPKRKPAARR